MLTRVRWQDRCAASAATLEAPHPPSGFAPEAKPCKLHQPRRQHHQESANTGSANRKTAGTVEEIPFQVKAFWPSARPSGGNAAG